MGLLKLRVSNTPRSTRFQIEESKLRVRGSRLSGQSGSSRKGGDIRKYGLFSRQSSLTKRNGDTQFDNDCAGGNGRVSGRTALTFERGS